MIRILLVDDQRTIRESVKSWLEPVPEFQIIGTASDGYSAIEQVEILKPDVVLIDMEMPILDGVKTTEIIVRKFIGVKVIVLSMHDENDYVIKALQAGATGYLLKNTPKKELIEAISFVHLGYSQVGPGLMNKVMSNIIEQPNLQEKKKIIPIVEAPPSSSNADKIVKKKRGKKLYIFLWLVGNFLIWGSSLLYLQFKQPTYSSKWTIALPASNSYTNIDLPEVGQASSQNESPYNSDFSDPRENYRYLALSTEVLERAADFAGMPLEEFGKPQVNIPGNTTLIELEIDGDRPELAQDKAQAVQKSLAISLDRLRNNEKGGQGNLLESTLETSTEKLESARQKLNQFKAKSGLSSTEQTSNLIGSIEQLRKQYAEAIAQEQKISSQFNQLQSSLGLSAAEASEALVLQSDLQFKEYLNDYSQISRELINLKARFSNSHPSVIAKQAELSDVETALYSRGKFLLGRPFTSVTLKNLNINNGNSSQSQRANLFQELISLQAEKEGLENQARTLNQQISQLETKLAVMSQDGSQLQKLQRELQLAEAVFASTATKLELNESQNSSSYPPMTLFVPPNLPKNSASPKKELVLLGSIFSSLLLTTGLYSLWWKNQRDSGDNYDLLNEAQNNNGYPYKLKSISDEKITAYKP